MNKDIVGETIGIYYVSYRCGERTKDGHALYHVVCTKCGWETNMRKHHMRRATQCLHFGKDGRYRRDIRWGNERLQNIYHHMMNRCYDSSCKEFRFYGGKGIGVCDEWRYNSSSFKEWALSSGYCDDLTIDRIDSSKNYSPSNCRWIPLTENCKYKSSTFLLEVNGEKHTGRDWAKICHLGTNTINMLLRQYSTSDVQKFIEVRLKDINKTRNSHQTWFDVYKISN